MRNVLLVVLLAVSPVVSADETPIRLMVGQTVKPPLEPGMKLKPGSPGRVTVSPDGLSITGAGAGSDELTATGANNQEKKVKVLVVAPHLKVEDVTAPEKPVDPHEIPLSGSAPVAVTWLHDHIYRISATDEDGQATFDVAVPPPDQTTKLNAGRINELKVSLPKPTESDPKPKSITLSIKVTEKSHAEAEGTYPLIANLVEAPRSFTLKTPLTLTEQDSLALDGTITGNAGGEYKNLKSSPFAVVGCEVKPGTGETEASITSKPSVQGTNLVAGSLNTAIRTAVKAPNVVQESVSLTCKAKAANVDVQSNVVDVKVIARGGFIAFEPPNPVIVEGDTLPLHATVVTRQGARDTARVISWTLPNADDQQIARLNTSGNDAWLISLPNTGHAKTDGMIIVRATVTDSTSTEGDIRGELAVHLTSVAGFTKLIANIDMMDDRTAADMYGERTADEFHVAKVTLLNNLENDPQHQFVGASVLVFSNAMAVGVGMERKSIKEKGSEKSDGGWTPVKRGDMHDLFGLPVGSGEGNSDDVLVACDDNWEPPLVRKTEDELKALSSADQQHYKEMMEQSDRSAERKRRRQLHYRPYPYDTMVKSFDKRDERSTRARTFRYLNLAGSLSTFISSVGGFGAGNDLANVTEKFSNLLIPAIARAWPSVREEQRQNIVSDTMHPIEEIPYGSSITKYIFIPRYPFHGFGGDTLYRIVSICPYDFQISVAVVPKGQRSTESVPVVNGGGRS